MDVSDVEESVKASQIQEITEILDRQKREQQMAVKRQMASKMLLIAVQNGQVKDAIDAITSGADVNTRHVSTFHFIY